MWFLLGQTILWYDEVAEFTCMAVAMKVELFSGANSARQGSAAANRQSNSKPLVMAIYMLQLDSNMLVCTAVLLFLNKPTG